MNSKREPKRLLCIEHDAVQSKDVRSGATLRIDLKTLTVVGVRHPEKTKWIDEETKGGDSTSKQKYFLHTPSLYRKLPKYREKGRESRFELIEKLGQGAAGVVYSLHDANCDREVAVKVLREDISFDCPVDVEKFISEARVVASLEHPNIIPIYDLEVDETGRVFICMRKVHGHTLGDYVERRMKEESDPQVKDFNDLVRVFLKVCDALAYAHSRGRVHQDVKPQNIMMGRFGQVFLIDWGASVFDGDEVALTPVYMSPEQAQGEAPSPMDDVYCLGATLFHCLTLRFPIQSPSLGDLWKKKEKGLIDEPTEEERAKIPPPLLAIAMKAMAPDRENRYQTVEELSEDLMNYQAGLAVTAHTDSLLEFLLRYYRRHLPLFWSLCATVAILIGSVAFFQYQRSKEHAGWGQPIQVETFEDDSWEDRWVGFGGSFDSNSGRLITQGDRMHMLVYRKKLEGSTAIEFEGEMLPGSPECDISLVWLQDVDWSEDGSRMLSFHRPVWLQVGAWGNAFACIKEQSTLDFKQFRLKHGKVYKIRAEIEGRDISIFVNGKRICYHRRAFPLSSGYICLYGYFKGKAFDNVKVYTKRLPEKVSITQVPDTYVQDGLYEEAIKHYDQIIRSHQGKTIALESIYRKGLCYELLGRDEDAYKTWEHLRDTELEDNLRYHLLERKFKSNHHELVLSNFKALYEDADDSLRKRLRIQWGAFFRKLAQEDKRSTIEDYVAMRDELFRDEAIHHNELASYFLRLTEYETVLERFPDQPWACAQAMLRLGRYQELVDAYPEQRGQASIALARLGKTSEALSRYPEQQNNVLKDLRARKCWNEIVANFAHSPDTVVNALAATGRYQEILDRYPADEHARAVALLGLGRNAEVLRHPTAEKECAQALLRMGQFERVLQRYPEEKDAKLIAHRRLGRLKQYLNAPKGKAHHEALMHYGKFQEILKTYEDNEHYCVAALGHRGEFDEIVKRHQATLWGPAWALAMQGRWQNALNANPDEEWARISMLQRQGKNEQVLSDYPAYRKRCAESLLYLGRYDDVLSDYPDQRYVNATALLYLGREDEVLERYQDYHSSCIQAMYLKYLKQHIATGSTNRPAQLTDDYVGFADGAMFSHFLMPAFLDFLAGTPQKLSWRYKDIVRDHKHVFHQRLWHQAAYILGKIDDGQFLAQPYRMVVEADLLLAQAMRAEVQENPQQALEFYRRHAALPNHAKTINPVLKAFVDWRIRALRE